MLLLSVSFFQLLVLLFPGWVAVVSVVILTTDRVPETTESGSRVAQLFVTLKKEKMPPSFAAE